MKHIRDLLSELKYQEPVPTGIMPSVPELPGIKIFLFDIYGTLLISSSGDIDKAELSGEYLIKAFDNAGIVINGQSKKEVAEALIQEMKQGIKDIHSRRKQEGIPFPEIDLLALFESIVKQGMEKKILRLLPRADMRLALFGFEFLCNKTYPMPKFKEVIGTLSRQHELGIVSNAQCYTPVVMNYFLDNDYIEKDTVYPFSSALTVFSYKEKRGKPDTFLFEKLVPVLEEKYQVKPEEVIFVGNDMLKDIMPASHVGFKTALFAGDKRSLRLREKEDAVKNIKPDCIITELKQLLDLRKKIKR